MKYPFMDDLNVSPNNRCIIIIMFYPVYLKNNWGLSTLNFLLAILV